jgi:hypothetical protein
VSNEHFTNEEKKAGGVKPPLQMIAMVFSAAPARVATLPEVEKPAANWTAALLAWSQA